MHAVVERHRAHPFRWGAFDCATLFGDCLMVQTGVDLLAPFRPWAGEVTAAKALVASGHASVRDFVAAHLAPVPPALAGRGCFAYAAGERGRLQFPAVVVGAEAVSRDEAGWIVFPVSLIVEAFSPETP